MKKANKVLTVLLVLALILTPVLKEFSVQAEEGDPVIQEETLAEEEAPEVEEPEPQEPEAENPQAEDPEGEFEFIPDEEVTPEEEITDPESPEEEETQDQVTPEEDTSDQVTPEEETPEPETPEETPDETPEETPEETEETVTPEETPEGVHFAFEEMTEADLEALPLSALLGYLRDGDGNVLALPEGIDTLWFRILDGNGNVVYNESYGVGSDVVLNLRQYFVTPGYILELTAGTGELEHTGNTVYQVKLGSDENQTEPVSLFDNERVEAKFTTNRFETVVKWREIFENLYEKGTEKKVEIPAGSIVMWRKYWNDEGVYDKDYYVQVNPDEEIDLFKHSMLELLVGTGDQLNNDTTELRVDVHMISPQKRTYHLGRETDTGWINMAPQGVESVSERWFEEPFLYCNGDSVTFAAGDLKSGDTYYAGFDIPESDWNSPFWNVTVYDMNAAEASDDLSLKVDVTSQIVNQTMDTPRSGYRCTYSSGEENVFAVVLTSKKTGEILDVDSVRYGIPLDDYKITGTLLTEDGEQVGETKDILDSYTDASSSPTWNVPYSDWASREYYLKLNVQSSQEKPFLGIVEGPCRRWDDAYAKLEAGGDLLPALKEGYTTEALKGNGVDFVLLSNDHKLKKFRVKVEFTAHLTFSAMLYDAQGQEALQYPLTMMPNHVSEHAVLNPGHYPEDPFFLRLTCEEGDDIGAIKKIVEGDYYLASFLTELEDIKPQLFGTDGSSIGYPIHYSGSEIYFTLLYQDDSIKRMSFDITEIKPTLLLEGVRQDGRPLISYRVAGEYAGGVSDTQYQYNYRTIFVYDNVYGDDVDLSRLTLEYSVEPEGSQLTANGAVVDRNTPIDFSKGPVHFTVTYEGWARTNYTISVVKRSAEPQLFVYPSDTPVTDPETGVVPEEDYIREIFLDENHEYRHDILIANLGDAPLTGIKVSLAGLNGDSSNMCCTIDDYWNVDGGTLPPFTETTSSQQGLPNIAKISLIPDQNGGPINGTLTISADGVEPVKIKLIGFARDPRILNEGIPSGVKYVPYSTTIDTNCQYDWIKTDFTVSGLPEGLEWRERTGEIYGIPQVVGEFTVTITANFTSTGGSGYQFTPCTVEFTLIIEDNTDENVFTATDSGYALQQAVGTETSQYHYVLTELGDELFVSEGQLSELIDVWLNGQKLVRDTEYGAESGSSRITVWKQTLENKADKSGGKNTLAAEFREGGNEDNPLHRTAQNFYVKMEGSQPTTPGPTEPGPKPTEPGPKPTEPGTKPTTSPQVPTQGPPTPTVGPQPTTPAGPTDSPQPTTPADPTDSPGPTTPAGPTDSPQPTTPAGPTDSPRPTTPAGPTDSPRPTTPAGPTAAPRPTATAVPTAGPRPTPSNAPRPTATAAPTNAPRPTATQAPDLTEAPGPSDAPKPSKVPNPSKKPEPTKKPNPTRVPQGSGTPGPTGEPGGEPQPSGGPVPSGTPGPGENSGASGTPAPAVSGTPLPTATPVEVNYVNLAARLTDGDGNPLVTRNLEMHSDPVKSTTDVNGLAGFGRVEYGTHTVYLKDENGNLGPSTTFTLEPGDNFSMEAGKITGERGSAMTISLTFVDGKLILNGVEEGIKSKPAPQTGDESMPGVWLLLMAISVFAGMIILRKDEK